MSVLTDFKKFAVKGNMIDLAIGVIIGGAFGRIISSIVADLIMPLLNPLMPQGRWREWMVGPGVKVGNFLSTLVDFIIVAIVMFGVVRLLQMRRDKQEAKQAAIATPTTTDSLLADIRDEMKALRRDLAENGDAPPT